MKIQNVKGGSDFLPEEQKIRNYINNILRETFEEYGYQPIETPILCYYDMLSNKYDESSDILKEIYKLSDQGNRKLGLRYDLTVPFAKLIALNKNKIKMPFKRYEIDKVFRDGPIKLGRGREFIQCDVDVVGLNGQFIEAELVSLFASAFKKLKIDITIKYNNRKLMTGLILKSGIDESMIQKVTTIIDKKEKISRQEFIDSLKLESINEEKIDTLLNYLNSNLLELLEINQDNNLLKEGLLEIKELSDYITELNLNSVCKLDLSLARGQNYYTGNVFEVYEKDLKLSGSIGGGGRYDTMITEFINDGEEYPAVGISFGLTSIYELLKEQEFQKDSSIDIFVIPINTKKESLKLSNSLRDLGYKVEIEMQDRKIKKSLDYANKEQIKYVIVLGEEELSSEKITIKNMVTSKNTIVKLKDLSKTKQILNSDV